MDNLMDIIYKYFQFLIEDPEFKIISSNHIDSNSGIVTISSNDLIIRLIIEREKLFMDLGNKKDYNNIIESYWIKKILNKSINAKENGSAKANSIFLKENIDEIKKLLNESNYLNTVKKARDLYNERWH